MRFHLTTLGDQPWNAELLSVWHGLVRADGVGRHTTTPKPDAADRIVFVDLQQHPADPFLRGMRRHPLVQRHPSRVLVHDARDRPVRTLPGVYVSAPAAWSRTGAVVGGPYPFLHTPLEPAVDAPDLLWSFAGARTHPVRDVLLGLDAAADAVVCDTTDRPMFSTRSADVAAQEAGRANYRALLSRSAFVLCPRGHGPSSFRLFETLAAGRVPVVISDDWLPPPRIDWDACIVRVRERDAPHVDALVRERQADWAALSSSARRVWAESFATDRLWDHLAQSLADVRIPVRLVPWWTRPEAARLAAGRLRALARTRPSRRPSI